VCVVGPIRTFTHTRRLGTSSSSPSTRLLLQSFIIDTDSCRHGLCAVLSERVDGVERPVSFISRSLTPTERVYTVYEFETPVVYWVTTVFNWCLWSQEFLIRTDSNLVKYVLGNCIKGCIFKWALTLQELKYKIEHHPGCKQSNADAMSCCPLEKCPMAPATSSPSTAPHHRSPSVL
jgi:hypothetical protein